MCVHGCIKLISRQPIAELLREANFLAHYKLVLISGPLKHSSLSALCKRARELNIPVLYTRSVGFYSTFSLQLPAEFPIVETHPDPETTQDLRLLNPWPELTEAGSRISDLDSMDDHQHGHVPYVLLLLYYLGVEGNTQRKCAIELQGEDRVQGIGAGEC